MANTTNITLDGQILTINPLQVSYLVQYPDGNQAVVLTNGKKEYVTFDEFHNLEELNYSAGGGGGQGEDPVAREEINELRWQVEDINSDLSATQSQVSSMQTALNGTTGQVETNKRNIEGYDETIIIPVPSEDWTVFQIDLDSDDLGPHINYNAQYDNYSVMVSEELMMMEKVAFIINYDHDVYRQKHEINDRYPVFQVWCEGQTTSRLFDNLQVGFYTNEPDWGIRVVGQYWMQNEVRKDYSYAVMQGTDDDQKMILRNNSVIYINGDESQIEWNGGSREETIHHDGLLDRVADLEEKPAYDDTEIRAEIGTLNGYVVSGYTGKGISPFDDTNSYYTTGGTTYRYQSIADITIDAKTTTFDESAYKGDTDLSFLNGLPVDYVILNTDATSMQGRINIFGLQPMNYILVHHVQDHPLAIQYLYIDDGTEMYYAQLNVNLSGEGWFLISFNYSQWRATVTYINGQIEGIAGDIHKDGLLDRVSALEENPSGGSNMVYDTTTGKLTGAKDQNGNDVTFEVGTITITI